MRITLARNWADASAELLRSNEEVAMLLPRDAVNSMVYLFNFCRLLQDAISRLEEESLPPLERTPPWAIAQQLRAAKIFKLTEYHQRLQRFFLQSGALWAEGGIVAKRRVPCIPGVREFLLTASMDDITLGMDSVPPAPTAEEDDDDDGTQPDFRL